MMGTDERQGERSTDDDHEDDDHLSDVDDGCGCVEVWEHLAERRRAASDQ